jgi:hypothetical protein
VEGVSFGVFRVWKEHMTELVSDGSWSFGKRSLSNRRKCAFICTRASVSVTAVRRNRSRDRVANNVLGHSDHVIFVGKLYLSLQSLNPSLLNLRGRMRWRLDLPSARAREHVPFAVENASPDDQTRGTMGARQ